MLWSNPLVGRPAFFGYTGGASATSIHCFLIFFLTLREISGLCGLAILAAVGSQVKDASGGPAGGQTFEKFDKQVKKTDSV
ncbi:hypothetical protein [Desulfoluna spongiiphila]|uniref:hypothetical protein n=1 Tax=Desulfoluna spongiiphila TaxID=419481 RepID=UPI00125FA08E|nr:hypothetical protein [Desulfoluna spongiiphila]